MWERNVSKKSLESYFKNLTKEQLLNDLKEHDCLHLMEEVDENKPYIEGFEISSVRSYNPKYGDNRICECGHNYYRHFDSYENMDSCGCKYCGCYDFKEKIE